MPGLRSEDDQKKIPILMSGLRHENNRRCSNQAENNRGRYHEDMAMNDHKIKLVCSKCGKPLEKKDSLPLCPKCLFGIEDINGIHKAKYPSGLSRHRAYDRFSSQGPSASATGR